MFVLVSTFVLDPPMKACFRVTDFPQGAERPYQWAASASLEGRGPHGALALLTFLSP